MGLISVTGRRYDLPPKWDGRAVRWGEWRERTWTTLAAHLPLEEQACQDCGALDQPMISKGEAEQVAGARHWAWVTRRTRSGRWYARRELVATGPTRLMALRCRHCRRDEIMNLDSGEVWELDASDYSENGSTEAI